MTSSETATQPMRALSVKEVEQVGGGALFGFIVGYGIGVASGVPNPAMGVSMGTLVSCFEDWVNGK